MTLRALTVTPNPSIDLLFAAETLVWDDANRVPMPRRRAGGQGINVTRALRALGADSVAATLLGGATGTELAQMLAAEGVNVHAASAADETRVFVAVRERSSARSLLLNPRGPQCTAAEQNALLALVELHAGEVDWVISSGSVPPGFSSGFHAAVRDAAIAAGARVVVDSDGDALAQAAHGCALLVPNLHEAERLLQRRIEGAGEAAAAARDLLQSGARHAAITLGEQGAVLATAGDPIVVWGRPPHGPESGSAVGAGDVFLAALLVALEARSPADAVRFAVAAGTSVLFAAGADLLDAARIDQILPAVNVEEAG